MEEVRGSFGLRVFTFCIGAMVIIIFVPLLRLFMKYALVPWWASGAWVLGAGLSMAIALTGSFLIGMSFFAWHGSDDD
jgi:hypothetical protein